MKISIAMATFNGAAHIAGQLQSFAAQTQNPDELIVCDDGSTDGTLEIVDRFARTAPFDVVLVRNESRLGFTGNFSKAMKLATGQIIFLSDQDDVWDETKIEVVVGAFNRYPDKWLVVHDGRLVGPTVEWNGVTMLGQVVAGYGTSRSLITGALTAFRRELQSRVLPVPAGLVGHDQWLHLMADLFEKRLVIPEVLQSIRRHGDNTSGWVASSTQPISRWEVFKAQLSTNAAVSYEDRMLINSAAKSCLHAQLKENSLVDLDVLRKGMLGLEAESLAVRRRQAVVSLPRFARVRAATFMLLRGDYGHFNGFKSYVRDVLR